MATHLRRYEVGQVLGDGTYGRVWKATNRHTGEVVALKAIKRGFRRAAATATGRGRLRGLPQASRRMAPGDRADRAD